MNILIVEARYHPDVADALVDGATAALEKGMARFERLAVPGVLEIPAAIAIAVRSGRQFDGYLALGSATGPGGALYHAETMRALTTLGASGLALGQGVVMAADEGAARDLAMSHDVGGDAARACLALITLGERLR
jgi:6,7-dimethyl-8-ribityllumazine synthase